MRADVRAHNGGRTDAVAAALAQYGPVRAAVVGQYGEASTDVHELFDIAVERATRDSWRFLGARSQAEARSYFASSMRRAWGVAFVREMARHRVSRLCYVGTTRRAGARAARAQADGRLAAWAMRSHSEFAAYAARAGGARGGPCGAVAARWVSGSRACGAWPACREGLRPRMMACLRSRVCPREDVCVRASRPVRRVSRPASGPV